MVDFLPSRERLVDLHLDIATGPHDGPLLVALGRLPEAIVLHGVADKLYRAVVELKVIPLIGRLVGPDGHRVDIGPENQVLLCLHVGKCGQLRGRLFKCKI